MLRVLLDYPSYRRKVQQGVVGLSGSDQLRKPHKVGKGLLSSETKLQQLVRNISNPDHSWRAENDVCLWSGVVCDPYNVVVKLSWDFYGLSGTLDFNYFPETIKLVYLDGNNFVGNVDLQFLPGVLEHLDKDTVSVPCWYIFPLVHLFFPRHNLTVLYARCRPALRPKLSLFLGEVGDTLPPHHPSPAHSLSGFSSLPGFLPFAPFSSRGAMRHGGLP